MKKIFIFIFMIILAGCHDPAAQVLDSSVPLVTNTQQQTQNKRWIQKRDSCAWKILPEMSFVQIADQASLIRNECRFTEEEFAQLLNDVFGREDDL